MKYGKEIKRLIKDFGIFFVGMLGSKLILYILTPIYTTFLTTDEYGIADIIYTTIQILLPILTIKISSAMFRFSVENKGENPFLVNSLVVFLPSVLLCFFGLAFISYIFEITISFALFLLTYTSIGLNEILGQYTKSIDKNKIYALNSIINAISLFAFSCFFLVTIENKIDAYFLGLITANVISCIFVFFAARLYSHLRIRFVNKSLLKMMLSYSWPLVPGAISFWIVQASDRYMALWILGSSFSGLLAVSYKIPNICGAFVNIFSQAWELSAIKTNSNTRFHSYLFKKYFALVVLFSSLIILLAKPLSLLLFQGDFIKAHEYVPLLVFSFVFCYYQTFLESIFVAKKNTKVLMVTSLIGATANIVLNYFLIIYAGLIGAVIATGISYFFIFITRFVYLRRENFIDRIPAPDLLSLVLVFLQALVCTNPSSYSSIVSIVLFSAICTISFRKLIVNTRTKVL